jgi:colanic acid biosynthesis glycosyl transferase WcaI
VFSRWRRARHVIWEMDIYPDIATDLGYFKKGGLVDRLSGAPIDLSRRDDMKNGPIARGIPAAKIHVAENWADGRQIRPQPVPDVETVAAAIPRLPGIRFVFSGAGPRRAALEFRPHCERAQLGSSLAKGHIGLVTKVYGIMAAGRPILYIGPAGSTSTASTPISAQRWQKRAPERAPHSIRTSPAKKASPASHPSFAIFPAT